jgi:hypothetical protein
MIEEPFEGEEVKGEVSLKSEGTEGSSEKEGE